MPSTTRNLQSFICEKNNEFATTLLHLFMTHTYMTKILNTKLYCKTFNKNSLRIQRTPHVAINAQQRSDVVDVLFFHRLVGRTCSTHPEV